eukprot:2341621-Pyramimonas_sp.AAC.1
MDVDPVLVFGPPLGPDLGPPSAVNSPPPTGGGPPSARGGEGRVASPVNSLRRETTRETRRAGGSSVERGCARRAEKGVPSRK